MIRFIKAYLKQRAYDKYMQSEEWSIIRNKVLVRDKCKCVVCGVQENLEVHHKTYIRFSKEWIQDLETLCKKHHKLKHKIK